MAMNKNGQTFSLFVFLSCKFFQAGGAFRLGSGFIFPNYIFCKPAMRCKIINADAAVNLDKHSHFLKK